MMTVCFEGFEVCVENENMLIDTFFKSFKTNGHHNLQILFHQFPNDSHIFLSSKTNLTYSLSLPHGL